MLARTTARDRSLARAKALFGAGLLSWKQIKAQAAARYAEEALSIFRERGDSFRGAMAQWVLGISRLAEGRIAEG
jgi:hypothetical protein